MGFGKMFQNFDDYSVFNVFVDKSRAKSFATENCRKTSARFLFRHCADIFRKFLFVVPAAFVHRAVIFKINQIGIEKNPLKIAYLTRVFDIQFYLAFGVFSRIFKRFAIFFKNFRIFYKIRFFKIQLMIVHHFSPYDFIIVIINSFPCFRNEKYNIVKQKTTGLAISDCYRRSIACSVTLVTGCANIAQSRCNRHSSPLYKKTTRQSGCWWRQQDSNL